MLPLMPFSTLIRTPQFVREEWDTYFSGGRVDNVTGGWRGVLYANLAIIDANTSYRWFSNPNFNMQYLDGGASLTWYLTYSAALGGSPAASGSYGKKRFAIRNEEAEKKEKEDEPETTEGKGETAEDKNEGGEESGQPEVAKEAPEKEAVDDKKEDGGRLSSFFERLGEKMEHKRG